MTIWIIFAAMTAAVMAGLLLPAMRRDQAPATERAAFDKAVFRDQLAEVERDRARGLIGEAEAAAASNEISRRLLQAAQGEPKSAAPAGRVALAAVAAALLVPAIAVPLYMEYGNPGLPDVPRGPRIENAAANNDFPALVAKVEAHLGANPDDVQGWAILAPAYRREQRWDDAAEAFANILRLSKPTAEILSDYGEMLVFAKQGIVSAEAHKAFGEALLLDPKDPKARFFVAIGLKQEGKMDQARTALQALLADAPADAAWRPMVEAEIADTSASRPPALSQDQMAAGASMAAGDQQQMIRSMVDGLEAKLKADANNLEGWLRLIRARTVLNEPDRAKAALASAREFFKDKPDALASLDGLAKELNLL